jgi:ADP-heptose:LPS heptosyltransferase
VLVYGTEERTGDGLIKLPFLAGLRAAFPEARLVWCTAAGNSVYGGWLAPIAMPLMDELLLEGPHGRSPLEWLPWARPFSGRRFDLVIDTQMNIRRTLALRPAARVLISPNAGFLFSARRPADWPLGLADRLHVLLELAAERRVDRVVVDLLDDELREVAARLLPESGYIGLAPGAGGAERRWPLARYIELATRLHAEGRPVVFLLGPQEVELIPVIREACPWALLPLQMSHALGPERAPRLIVAVAGRLLAAVASDAGPGHLLAAGGAPLVSLAIAQHKASKFRPATGRLVTLVAETLGESSIAGISLELVDAALRELLQAPR